MKRLRTKRRSRTLTSRDMKTQSSLEVPKQIRSSSIDENQLEAARGATVTDGTSQLDEPASGARSRSFDSSGSDDSYTYIEKLRHWCPCHSSKNTQCVHCQHTKTWNAQQQSDERVTPDRVVNSSLAEDNDDGKSGVEISQIVLLPQSSHTLTILPPSVGLLPFQLQSPIDENPITPQSRRSIFRQEALFVEPTGSSLENVRASEGGSTGRDTRVNDIYLKVPELKRDRAASVDSSFSKISGAGTGEFSEVQGSHAVPGSSNRSRSVDIALPTRLLPWYKTLALKPLLEQPRKFKEQLQAIEDARRSGEGGGRLLRSTPDWGDGAVSGEHLWSPTSVSGDCCYVGDAECQKHGSRLKCSACKIVAHQACIDVLMDRVKFTCKPTFRDVDVRQYREQTVIHHHWVHRKSEKGKCKACGKSFRRGCCWCIRRQDSVDSANGLEMGDVDNQALQAKLSFSSKEIVALTCSWCKDAYHNKENCFDLQRIGENCTLGLQSNIIVPPSWIVKLPAKGSFKSSLRKSPKKKGSSKKKGKDPKNEQKTFVIKPIPTADVMPVIVFINPKSGGNQGAKLLQKFQWHLNPRQVFDLTQGGPGPGLELFRKVRNLRILACGGDGTVGWVLSVLDSIGTKPAVGVLPLGTGNDLARALGWGGGYEDEPISKILANIGESDTMLLDRWQLTVEPNTAAPGEDTTNSKPDLPLNVVNNYFSFGVDAHIALEFHEAREAHPEKFNSRIRNKLFYGTAGGKDLMQRKWKGLAEFVTMECDGKDLTPVLREHRVHAIVFLNIPSYGGGTHPWNKSGGAVEPSTEDGLIEVVGLTTYQLPLLQAGGHGTCICQCKTAKIVTSKVIPMQVDGEACRLAPSTITISRLNQANMLAKKKPGRVIAPQTTMEKLPITVNLIRMANYQQQHSDKEWLAKTAEPVGTFEVDLATDLEQLRSLVQNLCKESQAYSTVLDWCFVDSVTTERFFRIDKAQETFHFPSDIGHENIYILDAALQAPDATTTGTTTHSDATANASLDQTTPSFPLDTTTGVSVSLDISQSGDSPSAGVSVNVFESHANESGIGSPVRLSEELPTPQSSPSAPSSPKTISPLPPRIAVPLTPPVEVPSASEGRVSPPGIPSTSQMVLIPPKISPPLCTTPPTEQAPTNGSVAESKTIHEKLFGFDPEVFGFRNLLEKTSDSLLKAAKLGDLKLIKELHTAGYSLLSIDAVGQTALHIACRYGHKEIVKYLISNAPTALLNMKDNEQGQTALHKATSNKRRAICCMLVASGATLTPKDDAGLTPRLLALKVEDYELAAYLQSQEHFQQVSEDLETPV